METMKRIKINDQFEFPLRINMEPYTLDFLSRKDACDGDSMSPLGGVQDEYELVGVLVHTGTADSGHYYSFIKERDARPGDSYNISGNRWYQFNDSTVDLFDPSDIPRQCYGGTEVVTQWDPTQQKNVSHPVQKPYSAYMLFYEKRSDSSVDFVADDTAFTKIPHDIYTTVWRENTSFLTDKHVFDNEYFHFLWKVLHSTSAENRIVVSHNRSVDLALRTLQVGTYFFLDTLAHSKDILEVKSWMEFLTKLYEGHIGGCKWFIELLCENETTAENVSRIEKFLLNCPVQEIREAFVEVTLSALRALRQMAPSSYGLRKFDETLVDGDLSSPMIIDGHGVTRYCEDGSVIGNFIKVLRDLLREAPYCWRHLEEYFLVLSKLAELGIEERIFMIRQSLVWRLIDFYLMDESPIFKKQKRHRMGDKFTLPPFRFLLTTVRHLVLTCDVNTTWEKRADADEDIADVKLGFDRPISLQRRDTKLLINTNGDNPCAFLWKQIREKQDIKSTKDIIGHLNQNPELSERIQGFLLNVLESEDVEHAKTVFDILESLYQSVDDGSPLRAKNIPKAIIKVCLYFASHNSVVMRFFKTNPMRSS